MNNADEISQAEKRRILIEERRMRTYHGHALDADLEMGGRFSRVNTTTVVGSSPIQYPAQPPTSPWHHDPCPPEPPLGYSVDEQDPVGEVFERAHSAASPVEPPPDAGVGTPPSSSGELSAQVQAGGDARRASKQVLSDE
jgi:hypothetical protein